MHPFVFMPIMINISHGISPVLPEDSISQTCQLNFSPRKGAIVLLKGGLIQESLDIVRVFPKPLFLSKTGQFLIP